MKDLGEILKNNIDSNQKHVKDHTKPMVTDGTISPQEATKRSRFKKIKKKISKK